MGIGSYDVTGDGYPDVYLTSQGANVLQTLLDGPSQPTYRDIALERGVTATRPSTGGDPLPSTAWHPEFEDVNNDGFVDLFVSKGNVGDQPDYAIKDPSDLFLGQPDGTFGQAAEAAGILDFARGRGAALADLDLRRAARSRRGQSTARRSGSGGTMGSGGGRGAGADGALDRGRRPIQPAPNRDAIGAWLEVAVGDTDDPARADRRRRPRGRPARLDPLRARAGDVGAMSGSRGPTATVGPWHRRRRRTSSCSIDRDATRASPWPSLQP